MLESFYCRHIVITTWEIAVYQRDRLKRNSITNHICWCSQPLIGFVRVWGFLVCTVSHDEQHCVVWAKAISFGGWCNKIRMCVCVCMLPCGCLFITLSQLDYTSAQAKAFHTVTTRSDKAIHVLESRQLLLSLQCVSEGLCDWEFHASGRQWLWSYPVLFSLWHKPDNCTALH